MPRTDQRPPNTDHAIRDRIKSLRRVRAGDLVPHPHNWRRHDERQTAAMRAALSEIGYAGALLVRETKKGLTLIDGHLRAGLDPDQKVPVLVLDVTAKEAEKILATLDPIGALAEPDLEALSALAGTIDFDVPELADMVDGLIGAFRIDGVPPPLLASGDRDGFQQMTFTLTDAQVEQVKVAVAKAKGSPFPDTGNENSNGNALSRITEAYLGAS